MTRSIADILALSPVMPIVTLSDRRHAVPLARALARGGVRVAEITLRTPAALDAIRAVAAEVPEIILGAGTVLSATDLDAAAKAGAKFAISPGIGPALLSAARGGPIPFLPGVATPSEIMLALQAGFDHQKFFPANLFGGSDALKAFSGPFPAVRFCPTGGVTLESAARYLALSNVVCVGGSWLTPASAIAAEDWNTIESLARDATSTLRSKRVG
jgi:2-dehydro-3-deoxyphosphogluconate aldolase/(4S)-4-hydroxy-2-oxoglutarate aldolase